MCVHFMPDVLRLCAGEKRLPRNMNMQPFSPPPPPSTAGLCPVTRMVTGEKVKGSRGRMPRLSVKLESPQNQQALVFSSGRDERVSQRGE